MLSAVLQFVHLGLGSLSKICACVRHMCPVLSLVIALSYCLEFKGTLPPLKKLMNLHKSDVILFRKCKNK